MHTWMTNMRQSLLPCNQDMRCSLTIWFRMSLSAPDLVRPVYPSIQEHNGMERYVRGTLVVVCEFQASGPHVMTVTSGSHVLDIVSGSCTVERRSGS